MPEPTLVEAVTGLQSEIDRLRAVNAELLAALKRLIEVLDEDWLVAECPFTFDAVRAVIRKAEGQLEACAIDGCNCVSSGTWAKVRAALAKYEGD